MKTRMTRRTEDGGRRAEDFTIRSAGLQARRSLLSLYLGVLFDVGMEIPEPSSFESDNIINVSVLPDKAIPIVLRKMLMEKQLSQGRDYLVSED